MALRVALGHMQDVPLPSLEEISALVASLRARLAKSARYIHDDAVEEASKPSDVANVRDVAMAPEYEEANLPEEDGSAAAGLDAVAPALDPVGVFVQVRDPLAGSVFDSMLSMLQGAKAPDESIDIDLELQSESKNADEAVENSKGNGDTNLVRGEAQRSEEKEVNAVRERRCSRMSKPLGEFSQNDDLLYGAFWHLFPLVKDYARAARYQYLNLGI